MNKTHALRIVALACMSPLIATGVHAQAADNYWYGGLSVGKTRTNLDEAGIAGRVLGSGVTLTGIESSPKDTGYKVFGGYQFNRYLALELGYFNLGQFEFSATTVPAGTLNAQVRVQGAFGDVVGLLPITDRFSALARVGVQYARTRDNFSGSGAAITNASPSYRHGNYKVGAGLQYAITPQILVRGEAERYRIDDALGQKSNANLYSVGLVIPFGRAEGPTRRTAMATAAPSYVAMTAAPAPTPTPAPAAAPMSSTATVVVAPIVMVATPEKRRVSYSAESLFSFDKADLRPEGKAALDTFVRELQGTTFQNISVEGHTDRIGTEPYNQTLSLARADTVKAYLVTEGRLDPTKISSSGKSEAGPVTKSEDCKGNGASARLIACLQPDRRVEIEVSGTR